MIQHSIHEKYMHRCIELARQGLGNTAPNPMVGSVIVYNDKIIGEGYHRKSGEPHAEVNAINSVKNKDLLKKSTIYVNLEPCAHFGKTPPCANLIAKLGIPSVIIGTIDTATHVSGQGVEILKNAACLPCPSGRRAARQGCNVTVGVLEKESRDLNKRFFTFHEKKRPYIILKWAQTKDGYIDIIRSKDNPNVPTWITNEYAKTLVHKWRAEEQSILIGTNTAITDNPSLTTRNWIGKNPLRIIFDRELKLSPELNVFNENAETLIIADKSAKSFKNKFLKSNVGIEFVEYSNEFYTWFFNILVKRNIQSIIVEGGAKILKSFIENDLWDEARIFTGDKEFKQGIHAPKLLEKDIFKDKLGNSKLTFIKK